MSISLNGRLPDGDHNGLAALAGALVEAPEQCHVAIVVLDYNKITTTVESGDVVPTARIRAIEPVTQSADAGELHRLARRAYERRTGNVELPLDLERELDTLRPADQEGDDQ